MALGNFTPFLAKDVVAFKFGTNPWTEAQMNGTNAALENAFATNNPGASVIADFVGAPDANNPTRSYAFARNFSESGNELGTTEVNLLGADAAGSQNQELADDTVSKVTVETTVLYRNPVTSGVFSRNTRCALIVMDNGESSGTGRLAFAYNNIRVVHAGSLERNEEGYMEQTVRFETTGGEASNPISVTDSGKTYHKVRLGRNKAEEIQMT